MYSNVNNDAGVVPFANAVTQVCEYAMSANKLFLESHRLLTSVLELAGAGGSAGKFLETVIFSSSDVPDVEALASGGPVVNTHETALRSSREAAQQVSLAALGIRRTIGWNSHPYDPAQRNGPDTLIGIQSELCQLYAQAALAAELSVSDGASISAITQRIQVIVRAANKHILIATENAKAVETLGALSIKILRALENERLSR